MVFAFFHTSINCMNQLLLICIFTHSFHLTMVLKALVPVNIKARDAYLLELSNSLSVNEDFLQQNQSTKIKGQTSTCTNTPMKLALP